MSREMVNSVKQALREIEDEKYHQQVHDYIRSRIAQETPPGKVGMAKCGLCDLVFSSPAYVTQLQVIPE
jgi:hypothetical protein